MFRLLMGEIRPRLFVLSPRFQHREFLSLFILRRHTILHLSLYSRPYHCSNSTSSIYRSASGCPKSNIFSASYKFPRVTWYKEIKSNIEIWQKPRCRVRILIYRTWPFHRIISTDRPRASSLDCYHPVMPLSKSCQHRLGAFSLRTLCSQFQLFNCKHFFRTSW